MSNVAMKERLAKESRPQDYCASPGCLWRIVRGNGSSNPCQNHPVRPAALPLGVSQAEELAILEAQRVHEMAVLVDAEPCMHDDIIVYRSTGDNFSSDVETTWGCCRSCNQWVVSTLYFGGGHIETRKMTELEKDRMQRYEDGYRRDAQ